MRLTRKFISKYLCIFGSLKDALSFGYLQHICGSANTVLCHRRVIFGSPMAKLKRASALLYFRGRGSLYFLSFCLSVPSSIPYSAPTRASVLNQHPTKMGYTHTQGCKIIVTFSQFTWLEITSKFNSNTFILYKQNKYKQDTTNKTITFL